MSIASDLLPVLRNSVASTIYGGYSVMRDGSRKMLPPAKVLSETRNKDGRCTSLVARYDDGSEIHFKWSKDRGSRFDARELRP